MFNQFFGKIKRFFGNIFSPESGSNRDSGGKKRKNRNKPHEENRQEKSKPSSAERNRSNKQQKVSRSTADTDREIKQKYRPKRTIPPMPKLVLPPEEKGKLRFSDLEICEEILAATQDLEFRYCTEIQARCLPYALAGRDLAAKAQTGTGKTAAFLAAAITGLVRKPLDPSRRKKGACRVLVLAPTRELAIQIKKDADDLSKYTNLNNLVVFGGMDHKEQRDSIEEAPVDILVGTPGRILDYSRAGALDLSQTEIFVIDEADRMLDMGFIPDVRRIEAQLPPSGKRQTMLFSATLDPSVLRLIESWLNNPVSVESEPEHLVTDLIEQRFYAVTSEHKLAMLLSVIKSENPERMLVFGNRKDHNRTLVKQLYAYGIDAELLSGDVAQERRLKILDRFRSCQTKILVATDVAARGIHVDGISHVVNYDLPIQPDDYVHRIGRTARAENKGSAVTLVSVEDRRYFGKIEKFLNKKMERLPLPEALGEAPKVSECATPSGKGCSNGSRRFWRNRGRRPRK